MRAVFEQAKVIVDGETAFLCLAVPFREAKAFTANMKPKKYAVEIKEYRERRSLDANAYLWVLLEKLANVLETAKDELYIKYVRRYGIFKDFTLEEEEAPTFRHAWEMLGTGWPTEVVDFDHVGEKVVVRAYYGSSQYNTKQMSRLINAVVEDCKAQGIDTLTPLEQARLLEDWK